MMRAGSSSLREKIINYVIEKESNAIHECKSEKNIIDIYSTFYNFMLWFNEFYAWFTFYFCLF